MVFHKKAFRDLLKENVGRIIITRKMCFDASLYSFEHLLDIVNREPDDRRSFVRADMLHAAFEKVPDQFFHLPGGIGDGASGTLMHLVHRYYPDEIHSALSTARLIHSSPP